MAMGSGPGTGCTHESCVTFRNCVNESFNIKGIDGVIKMLEQKAAEPRLSKVIHNGCQSFFDNLKTNHPNYQKMLEYADIPVIDSKIIPEREMWFFDQYDNLLTKFQLAPKKV